jgi:hypothetical protein
MPRLPSRYEDLDETFRGRLRPNSILLDVVKKAYADIKVSGGIRFLPIYGQSGCGKSCATLELSTHLPECKVIKLPREAVQNHRSIEKLISFEHERLGSSNLLITVVDQYEEQVVQRTELPSQFEPVQYYNLLLYMDFQSVILKSNPKTAQKMGILWL